MNSNNKTVSIHIVTYNSEEDIADCLEAAFHQDYPIQKIIVVDNASGDGTVERIQSRYKADVIPRIMGNLMAGTDQTTIPVSHDEQPPFPLYLLQNPSNTGFAPAHNQAIAASDADYVLVLNPDVTLAPDYVSRLVARMEADPGIGSATGKLLFKVDPGTVDSTGLRMNKARRAFDRGAGEPAKNWMESGEVFGVSGAAAMYSRRMIDEVSVDGEFFDADFFAYKEDVDVAWRARLLVWKAYYDADAIGYHERGWKASGRSGKPLFIRRISYINRYKMIFKNEPIRTLPKTILLSLPYEIAAHGYMLLKEPGLLKAWGSFFAEWGSLRKKRKAVQERAKRGRGKVR
ncbi:glycosyltransferase family 2 protein [Paenibacillus sp. 7124]|uniref:Glycosyltransferase family 2 protein n=1 Tax=Paenibacillus apii TaxID=1850370 RepID=A0A6M1PGH8_9BACL|nr:glycosyltransferase family 2 protein [Paenibacillus apii]NGM82390.1 glycosyltransferase family 2 protein [Paenibacillus apii]NJJ39526.1 glycosyltransferase family 2 protein [Paenibacillus apii]